MKMNKFDEILEDLKQYENYVDRRTEAKAMIQSKKAVTKVLELSDEIKPLEEEETIKAREILDVVATIYMRDAK